MCCNLCAWCAVCVPLFLLNFALEIALKKPAKYVWIWIVQSPSAQTRSNFKPILGFWSHSGACSTKHVPMLVDFLKFRTLSTPGWLHQYVNIHTYILYLYIYVYIYIHISINMYMSVAFVCIHVLCSISTCCVLCTFNRIYFYAAGTMIHHLRCLKILTPIWPILLSFSWAHLPLKFTTSPHVRPAWPLCWVGAQS